MRANRNAVTAEQASLLASRHHFWDAVLTRHLDNGNWTLTGADTVFPAFFFINQQMTHFGFFLSALF
jgi:hypothetical protein